MRPTHALIECDSYITNKASPNFSSIQRWMPPADRPFEKWEPSEVSNQWQCDCPGSPEGHPVPPKGCTWRNGGGVITFSPLQTKIYFCWKLWHSFHEIFVVVFFKNQDYVQGIPVQKPLNHPLREPWTHLSPHTVTTPKAEGKIAFLHVFLVSLSSLNEWTHDSES